MSLPRRFAGGLAAAHLVVVALGAAGLLVGPGGTLAGHAVRWYGAMTGADAGYSYFAPGVGSELRLRFVLADGRGREWEDELTAGQNQEVRLRIGSMTGLFPAARAAEAFRHDLAASWAAAMLGRHPDAVQVGVRIEGYEVPSMAEYRAGWRPRWVLLYAATFGLGPERPAPAEATPP